VVGFLPEYKVGIRIREFYMAHCSAQQLEVLVVLSVTTEI
jgi:hypothetical protein